MLLDSHGAQCRAICGAARCFATIYFDQAEARMAKNQNTFEKRRREIEKKQRAEEKRKRRQSKKAAATIAPPRDPSDSVEEAQ
jgi:hypothetical protein